MRKGRTIIKNVALCCLFISLTTAPFCQEAKELDTTSEKPQKISLVIPNLRRKNVPLGKIYEVSNAIRDEVARHQGYSLVKHKVIFEKVKDNVPPEELLEIVKESGAQKAVLGTLKTKRGISYLKLKLYNIETGKMEKKVHTTLASLRSNELKTISRGALLELLEE